MFSQKMHSISRLRTFRHIGIERPVFVHTNEQVFVPIGIELIVIFDDEIRVGDIFAFECNVQVIAHPLRHDVFRREVRGCVGQVIIDIINCLNANRTAARLDVVLIDNFSIARIVFDFRQSNDNLFGHS
ncbi:MAG: hypothetical protein Q4D61_02540 [Cardiobacteriaceae bacterium]|nr:hypothetical protein [Cardiobacteriaceae bacterium]